MIALKYIFFSINLGIYTHIYIYIHQAHPYPNGRAPLHKLEQLRLGSTGVSQH